MRDCMDNRVTPPERVTSPTWSPAPPCNQPLLSERKLWTKQTRLWTRLPFNAPLRITDCIKFTDRNDALRNKKKKQSKEILPFVICTYNTYNPVTPNLKRILMKHWTSFNSNLSLNISLTESSIVSYRKEKSLKNILVRAKIPSISQQSQNQRSGQKQTRTWQFAYDHLNWLLKTAITHPFDFPFICFAAKQPLTG